MYCPQCGNQVLAEHLYCGKCGTRLAGASATPAATPGGAAPDTRSRVTRHLCVLGILWIVFSMLRMIPGIALLVFSHTHFPFMLMPVPGPVRAFLYPFLGVLGVAFSALGIAGVVAGWGLLTHQSWARMLAIIVACITLIHFPLGTALGIYTLWVLLAPNAEREYLQMARQIQ